MYGIVTGAVINIALDPLLIFTFRMGIAGAGWATIISQFISFCLLYYGCSKGSNIRIRIRNVSLKFSYFKMIFQGGLPSLARQCLASLATICLNHAAQPYSDAAIAAMGVVQRVTMFGASAMIGFIRDFAREKGFHRIELNMWEFNEGALRFYESLGFRTYRRYMEYDVE
mgnify:CR=1 FL=1